MDKKEVKKAAEEFRVINMELSVMAAKRGLTLEEYIDNQIEAAKEKSVEMEINYLRGK